MNHLILHQLTQGDELISWAAADGKEDCERLVIY